MNSHEAAEYNVQGKRYILFNKLPQIPMYAKFFFFPFHMILFSSDIPFENSYLCKGILENLKNMLTEGSDGF